VQFHEIANGEHELAGGNREEITSAKLSLGVCERSTGTTVRKSLVREVTGERVSDPFDVRLAR